MTRTSAVLLTALLAGQAAASLCRAEPPPPPRVDVASDPNRNAYFGDLHLHTSYSFDAYVLMGTRIDPDTAYRFARGESIDFLGQSVRRREPLDFLAVTDHAENIGVFNELEDPDSVVSMSEIGSRLKAAIGDSYDRNTRMRRGAPFFALNDQALPSDLHAVSASAWDREVQAANRNYQPGKFTTFIAYEWTAFSAGANLHRNVIFKGYAAPYPFTSDDSSDPEALWAWLEKIRAQGYEALAIPHNANASNGLMYDWTTLDGRPIDRAYAERRQANEPLTEISQVKGSSETHPLLSPNDEFADFEIFDHLLGSAQTSQPPGSYVRDALSRGLVIQRRTGVNPYKYGIEGGSDLHGGLQVSAQADYAGNPSSANVGGGRPTREQAEALLGKPGGHVGALTSLTTTAGNLTGVWAESNTRESIYDALRRRETFATTGSKIKVRFFGGWKIDRKLAARRDWVARAYAMAVPMGADLPAIEDRAPSAPSAPTFVVWAAKDPNGANLDRIQIVKVWEHDGQQGEKIIDVAWSGHRRADPTSGKVPAVADTVDLTTGRYRSDAGATELKAVWTDPDFDPMRLAAYYLRVLEIPTPRWSTLLALENDLPIPKGRAPTEQQRAWSSPIWYTPSMRNADGQK